MTYVLMAVAVIVIGFLIAAMRQPDEFRITRTTTINASASVVFENVNDLHKWQAWSPWAKMDPNAKNSFEGPATGASSSMSWEGNSKVGSGKMTVIESRPNELLRFKLEFFKPFKAVNTAEFTFKADGGKTVVGWSMFGPSPFMAKVMGLLMNCEKMIGGQFDQGLASLKSIAEGAAK